ncbi:hypothetical protein EVAR_19010_1 [Eumeta japonica]|uniref:Reverse transcriptase domain-containing protein n=1 Tax=Eumeta variegata TaxID=151549 RepID=A0A4C1V7F5_EUMVA|nr:hypothetical protein EVAR_19010_1 [Eumeta japonica]
MYRGIKVGIDYFLEVCRTKALCQPWRQQAKRVTTEPERIKFGEFRDQNIKDNCLYDLREYECELRMDNLSVKHLLYTENQVMLAPSACELQEMEIKINDSIKKKGMKANVSKTKVIVFERGESTIECDISICIHKRHIQRNVNAKKKENGPLLAIMNSKSAFVYPQRVLTPTLIYGSESWAWKNKNENRTDVVEIRSLRSVECL